MSTFIDDGRDTSYRRCRRVAWPVYGKQPSVSHFKISRDAYTGATSGRVILTWCETWFKGTTEAPTAVDALPLEDHPSAAPFMCDHCAVAFSLLKFEFINSETSAVEDDINSTDSFATSPCEVLEAAYFYAKTFPSAFQRACAMDDMARFRTNIGLSAILR